MNVRKLNLTSWHCKYDIVFIPKRRKKVLLGQFRSHLGEMFHEQARRKECQTVEGHLMPDYVHMYMSIPPKHAVSQVVGSMKGESAIGIAREFMGRLRNFSGESFWARGYMSTVGLDEKVVERIFVARKRGRTAGAITIADNLAEDAPWGLNLLSRRLCRR